MHTADGKLTALKPFIAILHASRFPVGGAYVELPHATGRHCPVSYSDLLNNAERGNLSERLPLAWAAVAKVPRDPDVGMATGVTRLWQAAENL